MNLNQLKFVIAVSELSSFSAAADACFVTQPSLSTGIAGLEQELGEKLFVRSTRQVQLSAFGKQLMPFIYDIVEGEMALKKQAQQYLKLDKLTVKLGVSPLISSDLSLTLMNAFSQQYPDCELLLIEDNLEVLKSDLKKGLLDIILVPDTGEKLPDTHKVIIDNEPLYFFDKTTSTQDSIQIDEMNQKTFLMVPDSCGLAIITRGLFDQTLKEYEGQAMSYQVLENWALSGLGAAIIPKSKISDSGKQFVPIMRDNKPLKINFCVYWKTPPLDEFEAFLEDLT